MPNFLKNFVLYTVIVDWEFNLDPLHWDPGVFSHWTTKETPIILFSNTSFPHIFFPLVKLLVTIPLHSV